MSNNADFLQVWANRQRVLYTTYAADSAECTRRFAEADADAATWRPKLAHAFAFVRDRGLYVRLSDLPAGLQARALTYVAQELPRETDYLRGAEWHP